MAVTSLPDLSVEETGGNSREIQRRNSELRPFKVFFLFIFFSSGRKLRVTRLQHASVTCSF